MNRGIHTDGSDRDSGTQRHSFEGYFLVAKVRWQAIAFGTSESRMVLESYSPSPCSLVLR